MIAFGMSEKCPTTDLCTAAIASFIQSPRSARASSEGGMVSPTSPDMRVI